jgi:hypothetical protein
MADILGGGINDLDGWVAKLLGCTPLAEGEVMALCDKAREVRTQLRAAAWPDRVPARGGGGSERPLSTAGVVC